MALSADTVKSLENLQKFIVKYRVYAAIAVVNRRISLEADSMTRIWRDVIELSDQMVDLDLPLEHTQRAYVAGFQRQAERLQERYADGNPDELNLAPLPAPMRPTTYVGWAMRSISGIWNVVRMSPDMSPDDLFIGRMKYEQLGRQAVAVCRAPIDGQQFLLDSFIEDLKAFQKWVQ